MEVSTPNALPVIDSHQHFWDINRFSYRWMPPGPSILRRDYLPKDLEPLLREHGVAATVLVEAHNSVEETRFLLGLADCYDFIAGVVGWVDLQAHSVEAALEEVAAHPRLVGIRHQVESSPDDKWLVREASIRGLRAVAAAGLAYDLIVFPRHLETIARMAEQVPGLRMVLDHLGKPDIAEDAFAEWADWIRLIARFPNIWCKVSGMVTEADHANWNVEQLKPYVACVREAFGIERLMWGSDWPVCRKAAPYGDVLCSAIEAMGEMTESERRLFLSENAKRFYRLKA
ncbi:MAG TPA: amidohydrolase family protein [Candidatus Hydrogenedentes bacterium]|nr:amidohydrolase family protein [Candidatus Hydrogenedentota bacterium]